MTPQVLATATVGGCTVRAVLGDLTDQKVDAIVNAANSGLAHGGGLAAAIVRRGGEAIQEESYRVAPVAVGAAAVTGAGSLPCRYVIHAVGPRWGDGDEERLLRSAVAAALDHARRLGLESLALPAISTGIFGYPKAAGTRTILDEALRWLAAHPEAPLGELRLVAFDRETADLFARAVEDLAST